MRTGKLFILVVLLSAFSTNVFSTEFFTGKPLGVLKGQESYPWARIELHQDKSPNFVEERYHSEGGLKHRHFTKLLNGNETPHSSNFFLHFAPEFNKKSEHDPVLLVPGSGDQSSRAWAHPFHFELLENEKVDRPGLMQILAKAGYNVFSITFAHTHGDNFLQAEQIANCIKRIRQVLKREDDPDFKIDIVAHSKGGVPVRAYISSICEEYDDMGWMTPFRKDVDLFVSVATPLKGVDTLYRYYMYNLVTVQKDMAAPLGASRLVYMMLPLDLREYNDQFPGQLQMVHNWVDDEEDPVPFTLDSATPFDMNYTRNVLYYGGSSLYLSSQGIEKGIEKGRNLIEVMNKKGADPSTRIAVLAGNDPVIERLKFFWLEIPVGEKATESDGLLFLKSALYTKGILSRGATLVDQRVLKFHHIAITCAKVAMQAIQEMLEQ